MNLHLEKSLVTTNSDVTISGSKSETNRLLLLQGLYPEIKLENVSDSDDSKFLIAALNSKSDIIDICHAGTSMRFLTAYFTIQPGRTITLTGSPRMKQRPIKILVESLRSLGAEIEYLENDGFPPLKITGRKLKGNSITIDSNISSQYISALLLIAPNLNKGLEIILEGSVTSKPYIKLTLSLLKELGIETSFEENIIKVFPQEAISPTKITIESDWSSASYFYSIIALSEPGATIKLSSFKKNSFQGDSAVAEIYNDFGVDTAFENDSIILTKTNRQLSTVALKLNDTPDLAQTIAVTCLGLGIGCRLDGLQTLKIKETDRLAALRNEIEKLGGNVSITDDSISLKPCAEIKSNVSIQTYDDHRMAMAFAPLAMLTPIIIENAEVVSKSYREFWNDLTKIGINSK